MTDPLRLTQEQADVADALIRGRWDIEAFARDILGVVFNPAQRRWAALIRPMENGWEWRLKTVLHVAANQIGKTLGLAVIILWATWYKIGIPIDDETKWYAASYQWFHVAPSQNQAYLTLHDIVRLIHGTHEAQTLPVRLPQGCIHEVKVEIYYDGLSFWNGAIVQFRTTEEKAKAILGRRAAGISIDEAAFEEFLKAIWNEVLMMRLVSTGGPIIGVSTPNGINDWYEFVQGVVDEAGPQPVAEEGNLLLGGSAMAGQPLPMWETEDGWGLLWSTVADNIGFGIAAEEAVRMERDLDPGTKEQQLRGAFLEPAGAFFVPAKNVVRMFQNRLPEFTPPVTGHFYVISWDPSFASDPCVGLVLDVTHKPWLGVALRYYAKPLGDAAFLLEVFGLHALYNGGAMPVGRREKKPQAITVYDETSMGGAMLKQQLAGISPRRGINLAGPATKVNMLTNLRTAINTGMIQLPRAWSQVLREHLNYRLPDTKIRQDTVMANGSAAQVAAAGWRGAGARAFAPSGRTTDMRGLRGR